MDCIKCNNKASIRIGYIQKDHKAFCMECFIKEFPNNESIQNFINNNKENDRSHT